MKRKLLLLLMILSVGSMLLNGCGKANQAGQTGTGEAAVTETNAEAELKEYKADGVGVLYLPDGFSLETGKYEEPLPQTYAELEKGNIHLHMGRFGEDAYEAAGVPLPEDLEDYSTRAGVRAGIPEDAEFSRDGQDNLFVKFSEEDGRVHYEYLKEGTNAYGALDILCPEDEADEEMFALWASKAMLD